MKATAEISLTKKWTFYVMYFKQKLLCYIVSSVFSQSCLIFAKTKIKQLTKNTAYYGWEYTILQCCSGVCVWELENDVGCECCAF